jgi:hypothetical protein
VIGLIVGLACIGAFVVIKKIQSAGSIIHNQSLATNETKINEVDEIKHRENNETL